jgi:hypothetical protein
LVPLERWRLLQADRPGRCRTPKCRKIISFEQPAQKPDPSVMNDRSMGYKTRADTEYCDKRCANQHYYERETKPLRRQAAHTRRKGARRNAS